MSLWKWSLTESVQIAKLETLLKCHSGVLGILGEFRSLGVLGMYRTLSSFWNSRRIQRGSLYKSEGFHESNERRWSGGVGF